MRNKLLKSLESFDGQTIGVKTKAADDATAGCGYHRMVTELFALMDVADMDLNDGRFQRTDTVVQGNGSVCVGTSIQHNAVVGEADFLHLVDEFTLNVALEILDSDVRILRLQLGQILLEG